MLTAIRNWVVQTMMKGQTGVVRTLPKNDLIELNTQITAERMLRNGINPDDMKTVGQVENVVKQIDTPKVNVNPGVTGVKKADVLDMEGNKIPEGSGIMGGKEVKESDAAIKARIEANNEKGLASMKKKLEDPEEKADGGRIGLKGGTILNFLKSIGKTMNEKSPAKVYTDYLKSVKKRAQEGDMKTLAPEMGIIAGGGILTNRFLKKKLEKMNEAAKAEVEEKADGGRIGLLAGSVPKISAAISAVLKNKKKVQQAVDNIFPTGDYKYDAEMAADALVELNPKDFNNLLREDLSDEISSEIYGAVLKPIMSNMAEMRELRKTTRPEKTLQSMKEGKGIDISDPEIADEFTTFMKERDPEGYKKLEQTVELSNFKTKGRKENSDGGRIGLKAGMTKRNFLKLMGSVGAGIGAVKSGIFSGLGKGAGKTVAKEVAQQTTSSMPPAYFFKLAEKIKNSGDDVTKRFATKDREVVTNYQSKNGDFEMYEDLDTGDVRIKITKGDPDAPGYNQQELTLTKGQADETTKVTPADEYDEYTVKSDFDGKMKDIEDGLDDIEDIIDEIGVENITVKDLEKAGYIPERLPYEIRKKLGIKDAPSIKYASGGLAYMLGE